MSRTARVRRAIGIGLSAVTLGATGVGAAAVLGPAGATETGETTETTDTTTDTTATTDGRPRPAPALLACLEELGITLPDDGSRPELTPDQKGAMRACIAEARGEGPGGSGGPGGPGRRGGRMRACLEESGVELPARPQRDPDAEPGTPPELPELTDEQQAAVDTCREQLAAGPEEFGACGRGSVEQTTA